MVNFSRSELLELFFQEVKSYIPEMENALSAISSSKDRTAVEDLHRLFHNVKGAAAQVQLPQLSGGARIVEEYLASIVEADAPIVATGTNSIKKTVELLDIFVESESLDPAIEEKFYKAVKGMVWPSDKGPVSTSEEETLGTIRSLLPLLGELASCLGNDQTHREQNRPVYTRLAAAFNTLSELTRSSTVEVQNLLFQDFCDLLNSLAEGGNSHQDEVTGLVRDFLGFLEVAYNDKESDRIASLERIQRQLKQVKALLLSGENLSLETSSHAEDSFVDQLFGDPENIDDSISFLDELSQIDFSTNEDQEQEENDETDLFDFFEGDNGFEDDSLSQGENGEDVVVSSLSNLSDEHPVETLFDSEEEALAEIFKEECEEHFITINESITDLEKQVSTDASDRSKIIEPLREIRRAVHTLKGAASITGVNLLAGAAHTLEDMLDWLYEHDEPLGSEEIQIIGESVVSLEKLAGNPDNDIAAQLQENIKQYLGHKNKETAKQDGLVADDVISMLAEAEHGVQESPLLPEDSGTLRVRLDDLDQLLSVEGELVVARGAIEKMVEEFYGALGDLENVKENLRRKSQELESGFEVQALYGAKSLPAGGAGPLMHFDEQGGQELSEFDPIELDRYSELNLIIRSLNEISVDVNSIYSTLQLLTGNISGQVAKQQLTMRQMQDKLMRIRMTPLSSISRILYSTVRSAAAKLEKSVDLNIVGEDVYMDRFVWAKVTDPLVHILRNSVDHGIESPENRRRVGKQERGRITLRAEQRSRYVVLHISDDGAGIDLNLLKEKLAKSQLVKNPEELNDSEALEYIFYPSVSTKKDVTELSGRGVGLDVVKKNIQDLRGSIQVNNRPGKGVQFELHIPFTLSVNRAVLVDVAGHLFAIPLQDIEEIRQFRAEDIKDEDGVQSILVKDEHVSFASLSSYLQLEDDSAMASSGSAILFTAVPKSGKGARHFVLSVTKIVEQREIIVKGLGSHLTHVQGIGGVTVSGSGDLIPILNLRELVAVQPQRKQTLVESEALPARLEPLKVLIVDDSISVRYSIARLVEAQGWVQKQAVDGLEALAHLENYMPDVIVLDIEMPKMNGYEFKANINNRSAYKDIPVIMLTSRASEKHQIKAKELGVAYYMTKPYEDNSFIHLLEQIEAERN